MVANELEKMGRHYTFLLKDGDKTVSSETVLVMRRDLVSHTCWRDRSYDQYSVGNRLSSEIFYWAAQNGFKSLNWGGEFEYKKRWAPENGIFMFFELSPPAAYLYQRAAKVGIYLKSKACGAVRQAAALLTPIER